MAYYGIDSMDPESRGTLSTDPAAAQTDPFAAYTTPPALSPTDALANAMGAAGNVTGAASVGGLQHTGASGTTGYNPDALRQALMAYNVPASAEALKAFIAAHPEFATGVTIGGSKNNKLYGPQGQFLADVIQGTSGASPTWAWDASTGGSGAAGFGISGIEPGQFTQKYGKEYTLPSLQDLQGMPGYQAGLDAFTRSGLSNLSARGVLGNARAQEALGKSISDYGTQQYGNLAGLTRGAFATNRDVFRQDRQDIFGNLYDLANLGRPGQ